MIAGLKWPGKKKKKKPFELEPSYNKRFKFAPSLSRGVIGNTSDSGSEEFRFET